MTPPFASGKPNLSQSSTKTFVSSRVTLALSQGSPRTRKEPGYCFPPFTLDFWACFHPPNPLSKFVSASWDGTLKIWNPRHLEEAQEHEAEQEAASKEGKKKRKRPEESKVVKTALVTMTDHTDAITSVEWSKLQETLIVSGGNDSFVRLWDSRTAVNTLNLVSTRPFPLIKVGSNS